MIWQDSSSYRLSSPVVLLVIAFFSLAMLNQAMSIMLVNNSINDEYSQLNIRKHNLNHERKKLELQLNQMNIARDVSSHDDLVVMDAKKIQMIDRLSHWSKS